MNSNQPEAAVVEASAATASPPVLRVGKTDRAFLSSAALVFFGNAFSRGLGFLFPLVLARVVQPADFALTYFFVNVGFATGELVLVGFPTGLTRFVSADPADRSRWASSAVLGGIPLLAASIGLGAVLAIQSGAPPLLMAVVIVGLTIDAYYFALLRGLGWFGTLMIYRIAANVGQLVVLLAAASVGLASVGVAVLAYSLFYVVPILVIEWRRGPIRIFLHGSLRPASHHVKAMIAFSIPALVSGVAYAAIQGLDVYFVRIFDPNGLANYSAARSLAMPMQLVSFAITLILLPRVAATPPAQRMRLLVTAFGLTAGATIAMSLLYIPLAHHLVRIFPAAYHHADGLLVLVAPVFGLMGLYSVLSQWWFGTGRAVVPAVCVTLGAIVATIAELLVTRSIGAQGAAISIGLGAGTAICTLGALTIADAAGRPFRLPGLRGQGATVNRSSGTGSGEGE